MRLFHNLHGRDARAAPTGETPVPQLVMKQSLNGGVLAA